AGAIAAAVADAGMQAWLEHEEPVANGDRGTRSRLVLLTVAGAALAAGLAGSFFAHAPFAANLLFAPSVVAGVPLTARKAWQAARLKTLDINVLMLIAAAGAIALGNWSEAASVVFLFAVAQALEVRTLARARVAVRALLDLAPAEALVRDDAGDRPVAVDAVTPGTVIVVKPGEKIPL